MITGSSRPSDFRIAARSAPDVSIPTIWFTGSPAKRNIENEMIPTAIMTPMAWMARRSVKASICSFHISSAARIIALARNSKSRKPGLGRIGFRDFTTCRHLFVLLGRPVEQDLIVRALGQLHLLGHAPGQRLLMQWHVGPVLHRDLPSLLDQQIALRRIEFQENLVRDFVELLVAVTSEIG